MKTGKISFHLSDITSERVFNKLIAELVRYRLIEINDLMSQENLREMAVWATLSIKDNSESLEDIVLNFYNENDVEIFSLNGYQANLNKYFPKIAS